jgi:hypothetical protein
MSFAVFQVLFFNPELLEKNTNEKFLYIISAA